MNRTRITGWLGVILGALGSLTCIALLVVLWMVAARINRGVDQGIERIESVLSRVEEGTGNVRGRVQASRESVDQLEGNIETKLAGLVERTGLAPGALESTRTQSRLLAGRLEEWRELAGVTRELFLLVEETFSSILAYFGMEPEEREPLLTALENGQRQVGEAAATFEELLAQLESVREPVNRERFEADFQPLFDRIDAKLAEVIVLSETFSRGIEGLRTSVTETGARIRLQCRLVAGVLSLLVLWMGAGQWCLFQAGWRSIRPLPSSGGKEP